MALNLSQDSVNSIHDHYRTKLELENKTVDPKSAKTVVDATITALRRQNVHNTVCGLHCPNNDGYACSVNQLDQRGLIESVKCVCDQELSASCRQSNHYAERVEDGTTLKVGDHIFWHRVFGYSHHAIVTRVSRPKGQEDQRGLERSASEQSESCSEVRSEELNSAPEPSLVNPTEDSTEQKHDPGSDEVVVTVVEYDISKTDPCIELQSNSYAVNPDNSCSCAAFCGGSLYRVNYDDCYTDEYAGVRATTWEGKKKYNAASRNCEHASHWFKTGRHHSRQVEMLFASVGKIALSIFLRLIGLFALWVRQIVHERREETIRVEERKRIEDFARILNSIYIVIISLLLMGYFIRKGCLQIKAKPVKTENQKAKQKGREADRISPEDCAESAYRNCTFACSSDPNRCKDCCRCFCFCVCCTPFCCGSFIAALFRLCDVTVQYDCQNGTCCRRARPAVFRLCLRTIVRELVSALGPFLLTWYEEELEQAVGWSLWPRLVFKLFLLIATTAVCYIVGTMIGSFMEELFELFRKLCCRGDAKWKDQLIKIPKVEPHVTFSAGNDEENQGGIVILQNEYVLLEEVAVEKEMEEDGQAQHEAGYCHTVCSMGKSSQHESVGRHSVCSMERPSVRVHVKENYRHTI